MHATKTRLLAAIAGALLGLGGIFVLAIAATLALASVIGAVAACFSVAALLLSAACFCVFVFLRPSMSTAEEVENLEDMAAEAIADLPFDALRALVDKRPLTVAAIAMFAGYSAVRDPQVISRHAERLILGLL